MRRPVSKMVNVTGVRSNKSQLASLGVRPVRASFLSTQKFASARGGTPSMFHHGGQARGCLTLMPGGALTRTMPGTAPPSQVIERRGRRRFRYIARPSNGFPRSIVAVFSKLAWLAKGFRRALSGKGCSPLAARQRCSRCALAERGRV